MKRPVRTRYNAPPGKTSTFTYAAGGSTAFHAFVCRHRDISLKTCWVHISNANLGTDNPQLVSNFVFTAGNNWHK